MIEVINYTAIILSAILFSSQFAKYKISNFKPLNCEICLAFWFTIIYTFSQTTPPFNILISGAIAQLTKITNVLIIKLYGNIVGR